MDGVITLALLEAGKCDGRNVDKKVMCWDQFIPPGRVGRPLSRGAPSRGAVMEAADAGGRPGAAIRSQPITRRRSHG